MRAAGRASPAGSGLCSARDCWAPGGTALGRRLLPDSRYLAWRQLAPVFSAAVRARGCRIATLPMDLIGFGYAALVTFGSIFGYKRRGGVLSLIAGLFVGCLAGYGAYRVSNDKRDVKVSLFTAFFLATIMGVRFKRSKKIMPAGLVAGLSCSQEPSDGFHPASSIEVVKLGLPLHA
uniref:Transmembrane protein 14A n=1 Tax=Papio anubis TaxID=9555 RepID=A0A8I5NCJ9_PAPAN